ncbi:MAG: hypothetical protein R6V03_09075 [Kiritimatiellia bacterium]
MTEYLKNKWQQLSSGQRLLVMLVTCIVASSLISIAPAQVDPEETQRDPDQDGFSTELEEILGTDPADSASHPTLADNRHKILCYWPLTNDASETIEGIINGQLRHGADFKN